jgi:hypothetical protein
MKTLTQKERTLDFFKRYPKIAFSVGYLEGKECELRIRNIKQRVMLLREDGWEIVNVKLEGNSRIRGYIFTGNRNDDGMGLYNLDIKTVKGMVL